MNFRFKFRLIAFYCCKVLLVGWYTHVNTSDRYTRKADTVLYNMHNAFDLFV